MRVDRHGRHPDLGGQPAGGERLAALGLQQSGGGVRRTGGRLVLAGVAPRLARHLHVAGLLGRFEVCGTADEAVARVREPYGGERGEQG
ncbi:hypothetical protein [Microbispora bryophytorum]|uniref:hypothetical protein n=1 Tax=Microbispora bryophytorum TaxID=1460882 RepID=UPI00340FAE2D